MGEQLEGQEPGQQRCEHITCKLEEVRIYRTLWDSLVGVFGLAVFRSAITEKCTTCLLGLL